MDPKIVQDALRFAVKHGSVKAWERFYDLAHRYYGGKVSRKDIEAQVYAKFRRGAISEVK